MHATLRIVVLASSLTQAMALSRVGAQDSGTLKGTVATTEKRPLPQARIGIVGTTLAAIADTDGTFRIIGLPVGNQAIEVKMLGYATMLVPVQIQAGKDASVEVLLSSVPTPLPTVNVTADTLVLPEMRRFAERRARGSGKFFTRADIDHMEARVFTDILRRVPGMELEPREGFFGPTLSVQTTRNQGVNGGRGCPMLFYVNGMPLSDVKGMAINHFVSPGDVAAVEVYTGSSQIPAEYSGGMANARCGVVVIWTRISTSPSRSN
jgi:outer membrane receptor for Fe3+-dicitrate